MMLSVRLFSDIPHPTESGRMIPAGKIVELDEASAFALVRRDKGEIIKDKKLKRG